MARVCVHCGCTDDRACRIRVGEIPVDEMSILESVYGFELAGAQAEDTTACWWISLTPPVCSAPACRAKHLVPSEASRV